MVRAFDALITDARHALRRMVATPWLSAAVIGTLALAIAANATILSLLKPTVLRKLPVASPDALVSVGARDQRTNNYSAIYLDVMRALEGSGQFAGLSAYSTSVVRLQHGSVSVNVGVEGVTPDYFTVLGVQAASGRLISSQDGLTAPVGVITDRLSRRLFGGDQAVGKTVIADGRAVEIVGVLPPPFIGMRMDGGDELFLPLTFLRGTVLGSDPPGVTRAQQIVARLAPGVSIQAARSEVQARWPAVQASIAAAVPAPQQQLVNNQQLDVDSVARGFSGLRDRYGRSLNMVMALAIALMAVGCVNLCGLMLARALTRQQEFAVRVALGVSRGRLLQQALIDGVLLSMVALVIALPMAWSASRLLTAMVSVGRVVPLEDTTPDAEVVLLAAVVAIAIGLLMGVLPARRAMAPAVGDALRGRGLSHRIRGSTRALVVTQVALSMVLVAGAALFVTTLSNLYANDLQERDQQIIFTRLSRNPLERGKPLAQPYFENLRDQLAAIPGANGAAFAENYPALMGFFSGVSMDSVTLIGGEQASAFTDYVSPGFFDLFSIARQRGRDFVWSDNASSPKVAIVNEALARRLSPAGDVVGRRLQFGAGPGAVELEIVGVVADATVTNIRERHVPGLYRPLMQELRRANTPMTHVRVNGDVAAAQRAYVNAVHAQGQHNVLGMFTMESYIDNAVVEQQLMAGMAGFAAALAIVLASIGLFALLAYSVSSRVREIGVRMSIGATRQEIVSMVVREGLMVAVPGVVIGIPLALAAAWLVRSQLYGVSATDPWSIGGAALVFTLTAAAASWLPARRASRIQPIDALRQD